MTHKISLAHLTVLELTPPEVMQAAADCGYDLADLRLARAVPSDAEYPMAPGSAMLQETRQRMADSGVRVFDIEIIRIGPATVAADFVPLMEIAAELGASHLKVSGDDPDEGHVIAVLAELCCLAAPYRLTVDLEFMPWAGVKTLAQAARVVAAAGAGNAGMLVDALHLSRSGGSPADVVAMDQSRLSYLHLCDAPEAVPPSLAEITEEARLRRLIPGEGGLPLGDLVLAVDPDLPISLELPMREMARTVPPVERARRALAGTRALLASVGR